MNAPLATYRLQLHAGFTLHDAAALTDYLTALRISHVYVSPILQAARGSTHGYDVVDPTRIDEERGGRAGFEALHVACRAEGLGIVLDIVPNHLDVSSLDNPWWRSVLRLGRASPWAAAFDIDWREGGGEGEEAVVVAVLGETLEDEVRAGALRVVRDGGALLVRYHDHAFPLRPGSVAAILQSAADSLVLDGSVDDAGRRLFEAAEWLARIEQTPGNKADDREQMALDAESRLDGLIRNDDEIEAAIDRELDRLSSDANRMATLLSGQHYRLTFWRDSVTELNYRRFFEIDTLAGVRVEDPRIYEHVHGLIFELVRSEKVGGLRIDHPDGLRDPCEYFRRLARDAGECWIVAEKILEPDEPLRRDWPIAGTTGYDFLNDVLGVLVDGSSEGPLTDLYREVTGEERPFEEINFEANLYAAQTLLAADLRRLAARFERVLAPAEHGLSARARERTEMMGFARAGSPCSGNEQERLAEGLAVLAACLPIYRTYIVHERGEIAREDRGALRRALEEASRRRPDLCPQPLEWVVDVLLGRIEASDAVTARRIADCIARFQQFTAPVMAKGAEDTALYRYHRFIALNEVGGDPARFGIPVGEFHRRMIARADDWPASMLTTSTHDTKRSEDVRARLSVLTEIPDQWTQQVRLWFEALRREEIDRRDAYLFLQTIVGCWPIERERIVEYLCKAAREARVHTSWTEVNEEYESALTEFVSTLYDDAGFLESVEEFVGLIERPGRIRSLAQTLLKLTCPGVPDIYQGCELWEYSLVDPDNRRPVDFDLRRRLLAALDAMTPADIWATLDDPDDVGLSKLWLTRTALHLRTARSDLFGPTAGYFALPIAGADAETVLAYGRADRSGRIGAIVIVGIRAMPDDRPLEARIDLPPSSRKGWRSVFADASVEAGMTDITALFTHAPLALLVEQ